MPIGPGVRRLGNAHPRFSVECEVAVGHVSSFGMMKAGRDRAYFGSVTRQHTFMPGSASVPGNECTLIGRHIDCGLRGRTKPQRDIRFLRWQRKFANITT